MNYILLLILIIIISLLPIFFLKMYVRDQKQHYIMYALIAYMFIIYLNICLLEKGEMSSLFCIIKISQILIVVIISAIIYSEKITHHKILGISTSLLALYFLFK